MRRPYPAAGAAGAVAWGATAESVGRVSGVASGGLTEVEAEAEALGFASGSEPPVTSTTAPAVINATAPPAIASVRGGGRFLRVAGCTDANGETGSDVETDTAAGVAVAADANAGTAGAAAAAAVSEGAPPDVPNRGGTGGAAIGGTGGAASAGGFVAAGGTGG
ncbi:hypothetical protein QHF85_28625, partial [Polyangium sp. 6x1]